MRRLLPVLLCTATPVWAEVPAVAADIAPVQSLVAQVMGDLGEPALIVAPGASPHGYAMRPSEALALERAEIVFWIGEGLSPWLADPLETLAGDARHVTLIETPGLTLLDRRSGATFAAHDHDHGDHDDHDHDDHADHDDHGDHDHADHDDHDHDDHADHDHDDHAHDDHDDHDHDDHADHDHDHGDHGDHDDHAHDDHDDHAGADPHLWLDPENAKVWLDVIASELGALDPDNAAAYAANAAAAKAALDAQSDAIAARLAPMRGVPLVVTHDAFQYFEARFGLTALGSVTDSDAADPGVARVVELQAAIAEAGAGCFLSDPGAASAGAIANLVPEGAVLSEVSPVFVPVPAGPDFYPALLEAVASGIEACARP